MFQLGLYHTLSPSVSPSLCLSFAPSVFSLPLPPPCLLIILPPFLSPLHFRCCQVPGPSPDQLQHIRAPVSRGQSPLLSVIARKFISGSVMALDVVLAEVIVRVVVVVEVVVVSSLLSVVDRKPSFWKSLGAQTCTRIYMHVFICCIRAYEPCTHVQTSRAPSDTKMHVQAAVVQNVYCEVEGLHPTKTSYWGFVWMASLYYDADFLGPEEAYVTTANNFRSARVRDVRSPCLHSTRGGRERVGKTQVEMGIACASKGSPCTLAYVQVHVYATLDIFLSLL